MNLRVLLEGRGAGHESASDSKVEDLACDGLVIGHSEQTGRHLAPRSQILSFLESLIFVEAELL